MTRQVRPVQCIGCPIGCAGEVVMEDGVVVETRGYACDTGDAYAAEEVVAPKRMVTTTLVVDNGCIEMLPVVSDKPVPKEAIFDCLRAVRKIVVTAPIEVDAIVVPDVLGFGFNFIAARGCTEKLVTEDDYLAASAAVAALAISDTPEDIAEPDGPVLVDTDNMPWHDPEMPIADRIEMAEGQPLAARIMATFAQSDCGRCGYDCVGYANALVLGTETRLSLCAAGGKETARALAQFADQIVADVDGEPAPPAAPGTSRDAPVETIFKSRHRLNGAASAKTIWHIELAPGESGLDYEVGDSLGIFPKNHPDLVEQVISRLGADGDRVFAGKTLRAVLTDDVALGAAPDKLFELISYLVGGARRIKAQELARGEDSDGDVAHLDVLAALEKFEGATPDAEAFLETLDALAPRLYSISSSPKLDRDHIDLTVDTVRYDIDGRTRHGVASTFLGERVAPGETLRAYVQKPHDFALTEDQDAPMIMVGPGAGIAPFRAFLHERQARHAKGRNWLFFGHRHEATDFLYKTEIERMQATGILSRLSLAWSRDGAKKFYVQDSMRQSGLDLWHWLEDGAYIYVCGDAKRMAKDVERALVEIVAEYGAHSIAESLSFVNGLKATGRFKLDVY